MSLLLKASSVSVLQNIHSALLGFAAAVAVEKYQSNPVSLHMAAY
jgi:hypothetical protein